MPANTDSTISNPPAQRTSKDRQLRRHLEELVAALDRRLPHAERQGETTIAHQAAALRDQALALLAALGTTP